MKEGLGDILYFLAMIAFFVISAIAKSKKAKKKVVPPSEPNDPASVPEKGGGGSGFPWLDEIFEDEVADEMPETLQQPEPQPVVVDEIKEVETKSKEKDNTGKQKHPFDNYYVKEPEPEVSYWDEEEFDLRKAVIFSEILKRPEF